LEETITQTPFHSILFEQPREDSGNTSIETPSFFGDLNIDQIVTAIVAGRDEYSLRPFFSIMLTDLSGIAYRHEVFKDLEGEKLRHSIAKFAKDMHLVREHLAQSEKLHYEYQKASWFLDAVAIYCDAVASLIQELSLNDLTSSGFQSFREYLRSYTKSERFRSLVAETRKLDDLLSGVRYCVHIRGSRVTVSRYGGQPDYGIEVGETFKKFQQGEVKAYRTVFHDGVEMDHIEGNIVDLLAQLFPDVFLELKGYYARHRDFIDQIIRRFDREVQFYVAYLEFVEVLTSTGLKFCYPRVSDRSKEVGARGTFDLALADKLTREHSSVVTNGFYLKGRERIFVVSGPNQGGKTTFARTIGQLHYLARLGCKVPGSEAQLFLCDNIFTHFEREEHIENLRGKLQDELVRIHQIMQQATSDSIVVMNESFASTTVKDAVFLGKEVLQRIIEKDMLGVYVTFIDELSTLGEATVSMVSTVVPENPAQRTYKLARRPADGRAHAIAIAEKYGLTYETLRRRIAEE
jgi:DNA mismatch repair protein MutS